MAKISKRRMAENEVIFREANTAISELIEEAAQNSKQTPVRFYCECSREDCRERISLTPSKYKELHQNSRQFIALDGHEIAEIEKIIIHENGFNVIEKFDEPPTKEELNMAVRHLEI